MTNRPPVAFFGITQPGIAAGNGRKHHTRHNINHRINLTDAAEILYCQIHFVLLLLFAQKCSILNYPPVRQKSKSLIAYLFPAWQAGKRIGKALEGIWRQIPSFFYLSILYMDETVLPFGVDDVTTL